MLGCEYCQTMHELNMENVEQDKAELLAKLQTAQQKHTFLEQDIANYRERLSSEKSNLSDFYGRVLALEDELKNKHEVTTVLEEEVCHLQEVINTLQMQINGKDKQLMINDEEMRMMKNHAGQLDLKFSEAQIELDELTKREIKLIESLKEQEVSII